ALLIRGSLPLALGPCGHRAGAGDERRGGGDDGKRPETRLHDASSMWVYRDVIHKTCSFLHACDEGGQALIPPRAPSSGKSRETHARFPSAASISSTRVNFTRARPRRRPASTSSAFRRNHS